MGFRFQKRISIIPGLRLNLSKRGASLSVGRRGAWFTMGSRGSRTTVGIPGTGLFWTETSKSKSARQPAANQRIPNGTVITVPRDQADTVTHALQVQGYETAEQSPQVKDKTNWFMWICIWGFMIALFCAWGALIH